MQPIRILYVSGYADIVGGGQISLFLLLRHLDRKRFMPLVLCPTEGEVARRARVLGAEVGFLGANAPVDSACAIRAAGSFRRRARALRPDIVHCDTLYTAMISGLAFTAHPRSPVIFHARTSESGGAWDFLVPPLCKRIICVSRAVASRFPRWHRNKLCVIPNGVDIGEYQTTAAGAALRKELGIADRAFVIGYSGQLIREKGLDVLFAAFERLRHESPDARLLIAGRGKDETALRAVAPARVIFLPFSESLAAFYAALDVFALPTLLREGLSRALLEAMASGIPCVATPLGGNAETFRDGESGMFVPAGDTHALWRGLRELAQDPKKRREMGAAARDHVAKRFDAAAAMRRIEELYDEVHGDPAPHLCP
ncbi:MAG: glycosyltransferase family 4 protein [candidate division NC10 bacterium]|nr:glycosyltransferase family 4 protein [candidate division NC10 bacterium]